MQVLYEEVAPVVLQLLQGEDVLVEVLLKLLVGIVDVELLKAIHLEAEKHIWLTSVSGQLVPQKTASGKAAQNSDLKVLKAKDVKDSNGFKVFLPFNLLIDLEDDPGETLGI